MKSLFKCCTSTLMMMLSACSLFSGDMPRHTSIIPPGKLNILPKYSIAYADIVQVGLLVGAVYYISDPTAPTWEIIETRLPDNRVLYRMNKKFLSIGGDGECRYILSQRIEALMREQGMEGYRIERFEEAVDNRILLPRRTAYAEVSLLANKSGS